MKRIFALGFLLLCFVTCVYASSTSELEKSYADWCKAIGTAKGNPEVVVKFYAPDAILLPTLSPKILMNRNGGLNDYFTKLTSHQNLQCEPQKLITRTYGNIGINAGLYQFSYTDNGKTKVLPSRFTFVYEKMNNQWMIINHHSSLLPK